MSAPDSPAELHRLYGNRLPVAATTATGVGVHW